MMLLINKLKEEINIIRIQSQYQCSENEDHKAYLRLYDKPWTGDDDYLSKYQTMEQRQLLIKLLLKFLCYCITRNDPNLTSYNQNYVAHSRKILESSVIQDDILTNIFKIYETLPLQENKQSKD